MYEYVVYDWKGRFRWEFLLGVFLVDPLYEAEFLKQQEEELHLRPDLYFVIN